MTEYFSNNGIDPKLYENVTPPKPEHNNEAVPDTPADTIDLAVITMADFLKQEESHFVINLPGLGEIPFKLDEVRPLSSQIDDAVLAKALGKEPAPKERFSVLFLGPQDIPYAQGTFTVSQKETGFRSTMFLVPVQGAYSKEDKDVHVYLEAIFN